MALLPMAPIDTVTELMHRAADQAPAFSWGAATAPDDGTTLDDLLSKADHRLYETRRRVRTGPPGASGRPAGTDRGRPVMPDDSRLTALAPAAPDSVSGILARRRRTRRARVVAGVLVASAALGFALHSLTAAPSVQRGQGVSGAGTTGGQGSTTIGNSGRGPSQTGATSSARGTTSTARGGSSNSSTNTGTGTGSGTSTPNAPGDGAQQAGAPGPTTTTTKPPAPTTTLVPGLPNLSGTGLPSTSLP